MANTSVDRSKIEHRAFQIYLERGGKPGADLDDWLKAEREITRLANKQGQETKKTKNGFKGLN